ncbi:agamous-like MADS-box protein AGL80 [Musa acuminata AAA Group]|uniref:agamous-like MADS-box protein AGL80 n=1 Tax=Musa acuminata AAA Group TaxID=214697 RepID=UPI0031D7B4E9
MILCYIKMGEGFLFPAATMARKKLKLAWIANESTRRATYKKRKKGLVKKVSELATLCNVKVCMVIYGPQEAEPEAWPSVPEAVGVLTRFRSMPEMEQQRKMMDQEGILRQRAAKVQEQLRRQERDNRDLEAALLMHQALAGRRLHDLGIEDATGLAWVVDRKLKAVQEKINQEMTQLALLSAEASSAGDKEPKNPMEMAMETLQRQNWLLNPIHSNANANADAVFGGGEEIMPISYSDHNATWLDPYFPVN